jgi:bifunctional non-homologous end joining protein LigD
MFENKNLKPMLLKEISVPFNDDNYLYEIKFDGIRALLFINKNNFVLKSRNGKILNLDYPELKDIQQLVGDKKVIFDGEIIALDKNGKPSFNKLMTDNRDDVIFVAFDILFQDKNLLNLPLIDRKKILNEYQDSKFFIKSKVFDDGIKLFKSIKKMGLEGIVAKLKDSIYLPGKRVDTWLKIKNIKEDYFYIHGVIFNTCKYSLLLGEYRNGNLYYVGKVSVTKDNVLLDKLFKLRKSKNFFVNYNEDADYIKPSIKILVKYMEKTDKNMLRQPRIAK